MLTALTKPERGFTVIDIDYDYPVLDYYITAIVKEICNKVEQVLEFSVNINEYKMRKYLMKGLWMKA